MKKIDLHIHTTESDGTLTAGECVLRAKELGLGAIAITDHDTADGVSEAKRMGEECGIEVVSGIEISTDYFSIEGVHLLGYFIDPVSPALNKLLDWVVEERNDRNEKIAAAMRKAGIGISLVDMQEKYATNIIGRPHFAAELVERALAENVNDAFDKYLSEGGIYYRRREYIPIDRAFSVISEAGGKTVLAHPFQYEFDETELNRLIHTVRDYGAVGLECYYPDYDEKKIAYLTAKAKDLGMCVTGGSDFHGSNKKHIEMGSGTGSLEVSYELLEKLKSI